ncbi:hypothetical protein D3C72_765930 [compost metagenome]
MGRKVAHQLQDAYVETKDADWRTWRWSQHAAAQAAGARKSEWDLLTKPVYGPDYVHGVTMYPTETVEPQAERDWRDSP